MNMETGNKMKISKIKTVYFSPCGATKSVAEFIGKTLAEQLKVPNENISYTLPAEREKILSYVNNKINRADFNDKTAAYGAGKSGLNTKNMLPSYAFPKSELSNDILLKTNNSGLDFLDKKMKEAQIKEAESLFKRDELVIWASPVYAGRLPNKTIDFVKDVLRGNGTPAIPVVVFGNRNFDNALAELTGIMKDNGLRPIAGAAVVARHAFDTAGTGDRPSESDFEEIKEFCMYVANCIKTNHELKFVITAPGDEHPTKYYTPLKEDGTPANFLKAKPKLNSELCVSCGICSEVCPMGSIEFEHEDMFDFSNNEGTHDKKTCGSTEKNWDEMDYLQNGQIITNRNSNQTQFVTTFNLQIDGAGCQNENNGETEKQRHPQFTGICIKCQACIRNCPSDALYFDDEEFLSHVRMIKRDYSEPQENCFIC